jgi:hypothetical protein
LIPSSLPSLRNDAPPIAGISNTRTSIFAGLERIALAVSLAASLFLLGWVLLRCRSGFDFTDEGFYLNWISNPWDFRVSVSQFGFVYHPLYKLVGGDVALLRQCNVLITFVLAFGLCLALLRSICGEPVSPLRQAGFAAIAFVIASGSLSFFGLWLPSPSYNSLAFQSLMLAATAVLSAGRELSKQSITAWVSIGIAGGIAFLAKPTTAVALGGVMVAYIMVAGKFSFRGVLISIAVAALFLVVSAFAIDGSLAGFVHRIAGGFDLASRLTGSRQLFDVFRWDEFEINHEHQRYLVYVGISVFAAAVLGFRVNGLARSAAALIAIVLAGLSIAATSRTAPDISYEPLQPVQFAVISLGIVLAALTFPAMTFRRLTRNGLALFVFFAVLPHVYAFGTNTNYWYAAARAGLFWLLPGVIVSAGLAENAAAWRKLLPAAAAALLVSTGILYVSMENPYRQAQPLRLQTSAAEIGRDKSRLFLTKDAALYLQELHRLSNENGFSAGSPMLDLSGASPGSLYAIGARSLGAAWAIGGYSGSNDFVAAALNLETCEAIAIAWILTEPGSKDALSPDLLRRFGIEIARDYLDVGSIESTRDFAPTRFQQRLLKPARSSEVARLACDDARRANPAT